MAAVLQQLEAPHGVYAIPGNHEYFSGINAAVDYMEKAGINVLRDSTIRVAEGYFLVGRDDRQGNAFGGKRQTLDSLMQNVDKSLPVIMLDHQPFALEEAEKNGVDLQLSGHTHHGQLFPFNFITKKVYEVSWGYKRKGNTHYYVSCGVGTWGPPVRVGHRPEIVIINLTFNQPAR
jgi:predicted MPP superfamily phosphohydrolase